MALEETEGGGEHAAYQHADPRCHPDSQEEKRGGVGPDAEERGMAEGELPRVAAEEIPRDAEIGPEEHADEDLELILRQERRQRDQEDESDRTAEPSAHASRRRGPGAGRAARG